MSIALLALSKVPHLALREALCRVLRQGEDFLLYSRPKYRKQKYFWMSVNECLYLVYSDET